MSKHARLLLLSSLLVAACSSPESRPPSGAAGHTGGGAGTVAAAGTNGAAGDGTAGTVAEAGTNGAAGDGTAGTFAAAGTNGAAGDGTAGTVAAAGTNGAAGTVAAAGTNGAAGTGIDAATDAPVDAPTDAPADAPAESHPDASVDAGTDADSGTHPDAGSDEGSDVGTVGEYTNYCSPVHWTITANPTAVHATDYPTNIIDGNNATRWSTGGAQVAGQYIQIDLGGTVSLTQVVLDDTDNAGDFPKGYDVGLSANGTTFTSVATGAPTTAVVTINFAAAQGRYLRVTQTGAVGNYWSIDELRVACTIPGFNADAGLVDPYDSTYWKATASVNNADAPKAIDGVTTTRWTTNADQAGGESLTIDLGGPAMLSGVTLDSGNNATDFPVGYKLELSTNGTTYTQAAVGAGVAGLTNIAFARTTARYLRVTETGVGTHYWSVYELTIKP